MDTSRATPRPWTYVDATVAKEGHTPHMIIADCRDQYGYHQDSANAALIVAAVNQHDTLLQLVQDMSNHLSFIKGKVAVTGCRHISEREWDEVGGVINRAREIPAITEANDAG